MDPLTLAIGVITIILLPTIAYFAKRQVDVLEKEIDALGGKLNAFEREVLRDYVSFDRLHQLLDPIMKKLERIEEKLDGKMDKE